MKTALTIAGSDSCGGAGIQADLKTFSVLGVYGMSAITAITAQNTQGVKQSLELEAALVRKQIDVVAGDIEVDACKSGMLANAGIIETVAEAIRGHNMQPYVCDPVMVAKSGDRLLAEDAVAAMKKRLFPLAAVITPNRRETAALLGVEVEPANVPAAKDAARRLQSLGARAVLIKGIEQGEEMIDVLLDGREFYEFVGKIQPREKTHGSGCAFSAAITAGLANRLSLTDAVDQAKHLVNMAIQYSDGQGRGTAPVNVLAFSVKKK
jgi:hydroxymethylpyrimidine/phosphomethylpyrimidine kinase